MSLLTIGCGSPGVIADLTAFNGQPHALANLCTEILQLVCTLAKFLEVGENQIIPTSLMSALNSSCYGVKGAPNGTNV